MYLNCTMQILLISRSHDFGSSLYIIIHTSRSPMCRPVADIISSIFTAPSVFKSAKKRRWCSWRLPSTIATTMGKRSSAPHCHCYPVMIWLPFKSASFLAASARSRPLIPSDNMCERVCNADKFDAANNSTHACAETHTHTKTLSHDCTMIVPHHLVSSSRCSLINWLPLNGDGRIRVNDIRIEVR